MGLRRSHDAFAHFAVLRLCVICMRFRQHKRVGVEALPNTRIIALHQSCVLSDLNLPCFPRSIVQTSELCVVGLKRSKDLDMLMASRAVLYPRRIVQSCVLSDLIVPRILILYVALGFAMMNDITREGSELKLLVSF